MHTSTELQSLEALITRKFVRDVVDVDDTIPFELYSRPYDRLEIEDSGPYAQFEVEMFELPLEASEPDDVPVDIDLDDVTPISEASLVEPKPFVPVIPFAPDEIELRARRNLVADEDGVVREPRANEATMFVRVPATPLMNSGRWFIVVVLLAFAFAFGATLSLLVFS